MAAHSSPSSAVDDAFYQPAGSFFPAQQGVALTYDDVTLATQYSEILPRDSNLETALADRLHLQIPIISADMDTVTESRMAIAMALNGGLGLIHYNMPERQQLSEVTRVKYHVHGLIQEPIKVSPDQFIGDVLRLIEERHFSFRTFPIVDDHDHLLGLLPGHVVRPRYASRKVNEAMMPRSSVQTIAESELQPDPIARADKFFNEHIGIHKLLVVKTGSAGSLP
jgi:IMP dehydrogenase